MINDQNKLPEHTMKTFKELFLTYEYNAPYLDKPWVSMDTVIARGKVANDTEDNNQWVSRA